MSIRHRVSGALTALAALSVSISALGGAQNPGAVVEPQAPAELAARGVVYHTLHGREAQVTFTSAAPLEKIVGKSNEVLGYAVSGPGDTPESLAGARWVLPVRSLATGIPLRDEHIAADDWLDAESFPLIGFELAGVEDIREVKRGDGFSTWTVTLVGDMSMHGVKHRMRVLDARLSFLDASEKTAGIAPGDLLFLKCEYSVLMSDFGIHHKDVPGKVSDEIQITQLLRLSTIPADEASPAAE